MRTNAFLSNPVKVVIYDPVKKINRHTFIFLGDVPKPVWNACHYYHTVVPGQRQAYDKLLRDHYGSSFKCILGLNIKDMARAWISESPSGELLDKQSASRIGGDDNREDDPPVLDDDIDSSEVEYDDPITERSLLNHEEIAPPTSLHRKYDMGLVRELAYNVPTTHIRRSDIIGPLEGAVSTCFIVVQGPKGGQYIVLGALSNKCVVPSEHNDGGGGNNNGDMIAVKKVTWSDLHKCVSDTTTDTISLPRGLSTDDDIRTGGGDEEVDYSDIEALLNEADDADATHRTPSGTTKRIAPSADMSVDFAGPGIVYVPDIHVFPEDKFSELKDKIYLVTGIPSYRQHMFYIEHNIPRAIYKIDAEGIYNVDIRHLEDFKHTAIHGIPIDKLLYELRETIKVEAMDTFKILGNTLPLDHVVYIVDIAQFTTRLRTQLLEIINDTYQFELFYFGFIVKYWPQLTQECFYDYMLSEGELQHKYPDLARNKAVLSNIYKAEKDIINTNYRTIAKAISTYGSEGDRGVPIAVTQMIASVVNKGITLNIRNIFDGLRATRCVPEIHAYVENAGRKYMLRKRHIRNETDIQFPAGNLMKNGITIAISLRKADQDSFHHKRAMSTLENEQSRYMFLNIWANGKYYIKTIWNEEDDLGFDEIIKIMRKFTDPIITAVNAMHKYVFLTGQQLESVSRQNISYQSLNICVFWKKVMLESTFKIVKSLWDTYMRGRITGQRNVHQFDRYEFLFRKGMHEFDTTAIDRIVTASNNITLTNHYSHLSNNTIKQKWDQNYDGRIVRMGHRTTDIRFEVVDIRENEFQIFYHYILAFIYRASNDQRVRESFHAVKSYENVKKLKKLREQDPELFNLRKYGSDKVYSKLCQNQRQPLIYTADEMKNMTKEQVGHLTRYWNFTLNKPAYYGCPTSKYPHLSFMVGMHPKHYCLPCCNKKARDEDENKKARINQVCLQKHQYGPTHEALTVHSLRHIMAYGKDIDIGRLSKLPHSMSKGLLFDTLPECQGYYLYGVAQHFPGVEHVGVLYAMAAAMNTTVSHIIGRLTDELRKENMRGLFDILLNGVLIEYFRDIDSLITTMDELFIKLKVFSRDIQVFKQWPELFIELHHVLFHTSIVTFIDDKGDGTSVDMFVTNSVHDNITTLMKSNQGNSTNGGGQYIYMMKKRNQYYPIFAMDLNKYFRVFEVAKRTYTTEDNIVRLTFDMISYGTRNEAISIGKSIDLALIVAFIRDKDEYTLTLKFINRQNLCYAVLITPHGEDNHIYMPVDYSVYMSDDGVELDFEAFDRGKYRLPRASLMKFIGALNAYIKNNHAVGDAQDGLYTYRLITFTQYLALGNSPDVKPTIIGMEAASTDATHYNNPTGGLVFYCSDILESTSDMPVHVVAHSYTEVNKKIIERTPPASDPRAMRISESLYNNYIYQLFVIEFVNYLNNEVNTDIRTRIINLIKATDFEKDLQEFRNNLTDILVDYPADYHTIQNQLVGFYFAHFNKPMLIADIESRKYEFDRVTMMALKRLSRPDLLAQLKLTAAKFCVQQDFDSTNIRFPNVYLPCVDMGDDAAHCSKGKLIVNRPIDEFVDILAADLTDNLKSKYLLGSFMDITIDWLQFTKRPTEIISIYRLNE